MTDLDIKYSPQVEVERVLSTVRKLSWFREHNYKPVLPDRVNLDKVEQLSREEVDEMVRAEYDEGEYQTKEQELKNLWIKHEPGIRQRLAETELQLLNSYSVYFVRYGVGGSYRLPDKVVLNIRNKYNLGLLKTTFHEMVHLTIEPYIEKYRVPHWSKERVVDLLVDKLAPKLTRSIELPIDTEPIDMIFEARYPAVELLIKETGKLETSE